jgi:hypothetical protein
MESTASFVAALEEVGPRMGAAAGPGWLPSAELLAVTRTYCFPRRPFAASPTAALPGAERIRRQHFSGSREHAEVTGQTVERAFLVAKLDPDSLDLTRLLACVFGIFVDRDFV